MINQYKDLDIFIDNILENHMMRLLLIRNLRKSSVIIVLMLCIFLLECAQHLFRMAGRYMDILDIVAKVIEEESQALKHLSENLPANIEDAVNTIYSSKGRLAVSGIGKSGHIGRKISSTMASLGQKSFFIHPSEAHHGDLGMLDENDVLLLISYSGESVELIPVIDYAKRIGIKIISISKNRESTLAKSSDVPLVLEGLKEACPLGVAPTVSSTATLALGDALAIALLSKRGFTKAQFKELHPGGALGKKLSFTYDIMHKSIPLVEPNTSMQEALLVMSEFGLGCVGIIGERGEMVGIVTDGDLRRHIKENFLETKVQDIMTKTPIMINENIPASEALFMMESNKITNLFVVDHEKKPIGVVNIHDIISNKIV